MSRSANEVLLRMLQRLVNVSQQQGKLHNDCFFLCSEASKQKALHNKSLGDENRKKLKSWQTSMADVQVLEFVPSQWPLRHMKWTAASSRWTLSVKADCWAPMATPRDDVENALKKKLWRKSVEETDISEYFCEKKLQKALGKPLGPRHLPSEINVLFVFSFLRLLRGLRGASLRSFATYLHLKNFTKTM